jgi:hypothetical protein
LFNSQKQSLLRRTEGSCRATFCSAATIWLLNNMQARKIRLAGSKTRCLPGLRQNLDLVLAKVLKHRVHGFKGQKAYRERK